MSAASDSPDSPPYRHQSSPPSSLVHSGTPSTNLLISTMGKEEEKDRGGGEVTSPSHPNPWCCQGNVLLHPHPPITVIPAVRERGTLCFHGNIAALLLSLSPGSSEPWKEWEENPSSGF